MYLKKLALASSIVLASFSTHAAPSYLITDNQTDAVSNAKVNGFWSPHPSAAHTVNKVAWGKVEIICMWSSTCKAGIYMNPKEKNEVYVGDLTLNTRTGDVSPSSISAKGYTVEVTGTATTKITYDGE